MEWKSKIKLIKWLSRLVRFKQSIIQHDLVLAVLILSV